MDHFFDPVLILSSPLESPTASQVNGSVPLTRDPVAALPPRIVEGDEKPTEPTKRTVVEIRERVMKGKIHRYLGPPGRRRRLKQRYLEDPEDPIEDPSDG